MLAEVFILCGACLFLFGAFLALNSILVFNSVRYLAAAPDALWREKYYVRRLPNILKCLYDAGFTSPWPSRPTAFATWMFRRKLHAALQSTFPNARWLIQQHLSLWAFLQLYRKELQALVRRRQMQRAGEILSESLDADEREKILLFLQQYERPQKRKTRTTRTAPSPTGATFPWLAHVQNFDVLLREHGYSISNDLLTLHHWQTSDDRTILDQISLEESPKKHRVS